MAQDSDTIRDKVGRCLGEIDEEDKLLVTGYIREILEDDEDGIVPSEIH